MTPADYMTALRTFDRKHHSLMKTFESAVAHNSLPGNSAGRQNAIAPLIAEQQRLLTAMLNLSRQVKVAPTGRFGL